MHIKFLKIGTKAKDLKTLLKEIIGIAYKLIKKGFKSGKCKLKSQWNTHITPTRMAKIRMTTPIFGENIEQLELLNIAIKTLEKFRSFLKLHTLSLGPSHPTLKYIPKRK